MISSLEQQAQRVCFSALSPNHWYHFRLLHPSIRLSVNRSLSLLSFSLSLSLFRTSAPYFLSSWSSVASVQWKGEGVRLCALCMIQVSVIEGVTKNQVKKLEHWESQMNFKWSPRLPFWPTYFQTLRQKTSSNAHAGENGRWNDNAGIFLSGFSRLKKRI